MNTVIMLLHHNWIRLEVVDECGVINTADTAAVGTLVANLIHYGFTPSQALLARLFALPIEALGAAWSTLQPALSSMTGDDRDMQGFVVYPNFPSEVMALNKAQYWINQACVYAGFPNEWFASPPAPRSSLIEDHPLKTLHLAPVDAEVQIWRTLQTAKSRWNDNQAQWAKVLCNLTDAAAMGLQDFGFKENGLRMIHQAMSEHNLAPNIRDATDVLRLAALMSDQDVSLRSPVKFRSFRRPECRMLLRMLDGSHHLSEDIARRPEQWKRLLSRLHVANYPFENVQHAYDKLFNGRLKANNRALESALRTADPAALSTLQRQPGEFIRRFHQLYARFANAAVTACIEIINDATSVQLVKFDRYLETINDRKLMMYAPKGNWGKTQIAPNKKMAIVPEDLERLRDVISSTLKYRLDQRLPGGITLDSRLAQIKLPTNDQELAAYGRGTRFSIPEHISYIRTASYWCTGEAESNLWFDNSWNFFDAAWRPLGACCWDHECYPGDSSSDLSRADKAALFSGDPASSTDPEGRACQMIDLYLDRLQEQGVRYAVWSVHSYNKVPFGAVEEVLAALQWGQDSEAGALYEPSRAQMCFSVTGNNLSKYVALLDIDKRALTYLDANLYGRVNSANLNGNILAQQMPAYLEYLNGLPSVHDLLGHASRGAIPCCYSDETLSIEGEQPAYVFKPQNPSNNYQPISLGDLLSSPDR